MITVNEWTYEKPSIPGQYFIRAGFQSRPVRCIIDYNDHGALWVYEDGRGIDAVKCLGHDVEFKLISRAIVGSRSVTPIRESDIMGVATIDLETGGWIKFPVGWTVKQVPEPSVDSLFALAQKNPTVYAFLQNWRRGFSTYEQALTQMVFSLVEQNDMLMANSQINLARRDLFFDDFKVKLLKAEEIPLKPYPLDDVDKDVVEPQFRPATD